LLKYVRLFICLILIIIFTIRTNYMIDLFKSAKKRDSRLDVKAFTVYKGFDASDILVYVGTTTQKPKDRFRWHKHNGKDLRFEIVEQFDNETDMIELEFQLIKDLKPLLNKITHRRQNLNKKLTQAELDARIGDKAWCQSCLRRRVNPGYAKCMRC
jgi:hypothetical protein